ALLVERNTGWRLRDSGDARNGLDNRNVRPHEFQRYHALNEVGILEDGVEDRLVLLEKAIVACKELAADVGESAVGGEVLRVSDRISLIPGVDLILDDAANCRFIGRRLSSGATGYSEGDECDKPFHATSG